MLDLAEIALLALKEAKNNIYTKVVLLWCYKMLLKGKIRALKKITD
jgi:hypothetical protein